MTNINLLPWRERRRRRRTRWFLASMAAALAASASVVVLCAVLLNRQLGSQQRINLALDGRIGDVDRRLAEIDELRAHQETLASRIAVLRRLNGLRFEPVAVLDELARTLVPGLRYTALARRGDQIAAQGVAFSQGDVSALMRNLRDSARFASPSLKNIVEADAGGDGTVFELTFTVVSARSGSSASGGVTDER